MAVEVSIGAAVAAEEAAGEAAAGIRYPSPAHPTSASESATRTNAMAFMDLDGTD